MTLTTYDETLCKIIEPNVSSTNERFETLKIFRDNGIPTVVWLSPFLPFINDTEENINGLMDYCTKAKVKGVICFGIGLTLRQGNREYFYKQIDKNFPGLKNQYIRAYGNSYEIASPNHEKLINIVNSRCKKENIMYNKDEIFSYLHKFEYKQTQMSLFDI